MAFELHVPEINFFLVMSECAGVSLYAALDSDQVFAERVNRIFTDDRRSWPNFEPTGGGSTSTEQDVLDTNVN